MDAIDFGYATEIVRKSRKSQAQKRGRRVDAEGRPLRSTKKQKAVKAAVFGILFGGFGG